MSTRTASRDTNPLSRCKRRALAGAALVAFAAASLSPRRRRRSGSR